MDLFGDDNINEEGFSDDSLSTLDVTEPEADALRPPKSSSFFIGHDLIERDLLDLWRSNRMPHAIILNGIKGVGKATLAYRLSRFIMKESNSNGALFGDDDTKAESMDVAQDHDVFRKLASGGHPDFRSLELPFDDAKGKFKKEIPVDDIRKIAPFLRQSSANGGWRIVLIDDANTMGRAGQNALLKILEEPPKNTLLILVTHGAGGLLPTIRSRCRFIPFDPLPNDTMNVLIQKASPTPLMPDDMDLIAALSEGSAGKAVSLIQNGDISAIHDIFDILNSVHNLDEDKLNAIALAYGKSGDQGAADQLIEIVYWWIEKLIHMTVNDRTNQSIGHIDMALPQGATLQSLLKLYETVDGHVTTCLSSTLDKRYMIYKMLRLLQG